MPVPDDFIGWLREQPEKDIPILAEFAEHEMVRLISGSLSIYTATVEHQRAPGADVRIRFENGASGVFPANAIERT